MQGHGWTIRLREIFGGNLSELTEAHLKRLVDGGVREDDDLDFKRERYGGSDSQKREFAADIAAMANHRGGAVVIGIQEDNEIATGLTPVEPADGEEDRLRQIGASLVFPHAPFEVQTVPSSSEGGMVYYVLVIPPSPLRPHAVRKDIDLRYPRRDGSNTRWLAEAEVADMYRNRFHMVEDQLGRMDSMFEAGLAEMELKDQWAYLAVALVPTSSGSMSMDLARVREIEEWATEKGGTFAWRGFFGSRPDGRTGIRRVRLGSLLSESRPASDYAELHVDGASFTCADVGRRPPHHVGETEPKCVQIPSVALPWALAQMLRLSGRHAIENTGAWGDALVETRLFGLEKQLTYPIHRGMLQEPWNHRPMNDSIVTRQTVPLESLAGSDRDLLVATRLIATDLVNAFGAPEVRQIDEQGRVRLHYVSDAQRIEAFAKARDVEVTEERIQG